MDERCSKEAVGSALLNLGDQIINLNHLMLSLCGQLQIVHNSLQACYDQTVMFVEEANGGTWPNPAPSREFPELNHKGD